MDFQTRYVFDPKEDLLGKGGFSKVYKANDILLERTVALKFFTAKTSEKYQVLNEIKKVIRFEHPNLCKYYDVALLNYKNVLDETEQMEVGIMEYIDAGDFKNFLRKNPEYTDKLLIDVLKGLAYLHKRGMAHRDLKPQNILIKMVDDEPVAKITDFGISKMIDSEEGNSSALLGTIEYMAPEQFNPKKYGINGRIATNLDLWSYGLLIYEAICHQSLFGSRSSGISAEQVMSNILSDIPLEKAEALPPKYREVMKRCLVKNASERVQNALELIPLLQENGPLSIPVKEPQQTDSGKIALGETQVLAPPVLEQPEETQTINRSPEPEAIETTVLDLLKDPLPETPQPGKEQSRPEEENEPTDSETAVLQQAEEAVEVEPAEETQVIPKMAPVEKEETQVLDRMPEVATAEEEQTQVISKKLVVPAEKTTVEKPWSAAVSQPRQKEVAKKPGNKILLLAAAAVLLVIIFLVFGLSKNPEPKPDVVNTPAPQPKPTPPKFEPPATVPVSGGTFMMGDGAGASAPVHAVTINSFEIGKYEVMVGEFRKFVEEEHYRTTAEQKGYSEVFDGKSWKKTPNINWRYDTKGNLIAPDNSRVPVVHVSWTDANAYCAWLSKKTGSRYRLLTEAEWEYASKGGRDSSGFTYSGSNDVDQVAWYKGNSNGDIHPVAQKQANKLGIFDMSGNAIEWCNDWYNASYYKSSPAENPTGPDKPGNERQRVLRGGAWALVKDFCKTTFRTGFIEDQSGGNIGFRIAKTEKN